MYLVMEEYMSMFKRVFFFMLVNVLVIATISIILSLLGVGRYVQGGQLNIGALAVFCLVWGMVGSFISLLISRWMAKRAFGVQLIDPGTMTSGHRELIEMVKRMTVAARIPMPEVGIYQSPEPNAFATGPSKNKSLIAVSTGLLSAMDRAEVEGVIGHEVSHIANGDMVTMTLIQGIVNSFAMFLSRVLSFFFSSFVDDRFEHIVRFVLTLLFDILFTILGSIAVAYYSRAREFRADYGSARIAGKSNMIAALRKLQALHDVEEDPRGASMASFKISGRRKAISLFSTHPALEDRIRALETMSI